MTARHPGLDPESNQTISAYGGIFYWLGVLLQSLRITAIPGGQIPGQARYDVNENYSIREPAQSKPKWSDLDLTC